MQVEFKFSIKQKVRITDSGQTGQVVGNFIDRHGHKSAMVRHPLDTGEVSEDWEYEDDLELA